ncbi:MAG TPA: four helix bundle protein [Candidatus Limnocylindria bacterium]|nr:four helix bundle protein [Candidatus Limnocylindria bacterium]
MGTLNTNGYFEQLKAKMNAYVHFIYKLSKEFPKDELYGCTSQLRRATLSIILNFIEGYARKKIAVKRNFWEISYGSLQESKYLVDFSFEEKYIKEEDYKKAVMMADEIGAMLWRALEPLSE